MNPCSNPSLARRAAPYGSISPPRIKVSGPKHRPWTSREASPPGGRGEPLSTVPDQPDRLVRPWRAVVPDAETVVSSASTAIHRWETRRFQCRLSVPQRQLVLVERSVERDAHQSWRKPSATAWVIRAGEAAASRKARSSGERLSELASRPSVDSSAMWLQPPDRCIRREGKDQTSRTGQLAEHQRGLVSGRARRCAAGQLPWCRTTESGVLPSCGHADAEVALQGPGIVQWYLESLLR